MSINKQYKDLTDNDMKELGIISVPLSTITSQLSEDDWNKKSTGTGKTLRERYQENPKMTVPTLNNKLFTRSVYENMQYQSQLPYQEQNDNAADEWLRRRNADRFVGTLGITDWTNPAQRNNFFNLLGYTIAGTGTALGGSMLIPLIGSGSAALPILGNMAKDIGTGYLLGKTFDKGLQLTTGKNWAQLANNTLGLDENNMFGLTTNPAMWAGGIYGSKVRQLPFKTPIAKRTLEVAMRSSLGDADPIPKYKQDLKVLLNTKWGRKQLGRVGNYILTGIKPSNSSLPYRTIDAEGKEYTGFIGEGMPWENGNFKFNNDLIDAAVYGKTVDPRLLKLISKGNPEDFGIYRKYIFDNYLNKLKKVQVYEAGPGDEAVDYTELNSQSPSKIDYSNSKIEGTNGSLVTKHPDYRINTAGHHIIESPEGVSVSEDVWKFLPSEYVPKWEINGMLKRALLTQANKMLNPIIIKSQPYKQIHIGEEFPKYSEGFIMPSIKKFYAKMGFTPEGYDKINQMLKNLNYDELVKGSLNSKKFLTESQSKSEDLPY